jgi:uncharacterized Zn finger protein
MTAAISQTQREYNAIDRATLENITIAARGSIKATGARFFLVNGSHGATYTVLVYADRLSCSCAAGQHGIVCKHRAAVHQALVAERSAADDSAAARRETAPLYRSNDALSIWK